MTHYFLSTLTRISDLATRDFEVEVLAHRHWANGDYVVGQVQGDSHLLAPIELANGRLAHAMQGDLVIGALGVRQATLEAVGDWQAIEADGVMENMTYAGIFGKVTSQSSFIPPLTTLKYQGHVIRDRQKVCMTEFAPPAPEIDFNSPTILIIGTSMSAGKTTVARALIHQLKNLGLTVAGTKLTGVGRYRDILAMKDAGADWIYDFVDVGLPSSILDPEDYRRSLGQLLKMVATHQPDVMVAEAGASPYEPYNGSVVLEEIAEFLKLTVLCASDPYAVIGVSQSFGLTPDLVSGVTTSTSAGIRLVESLTHFPALKIPSETSDAKLQRILVDKLGIYS